MTNTINSNIEFDGIKLPSEYSLDFLNILFSDYTMMWKMRYQPTDLFSVPIWLEFLDIISHDMLTLVELNLGQELIEEYKTYVQNNNWSTEFLIRQSCKNIDNAVKFLRIHFDKLRGKKRTLNVKKKQRHLKLVKLNTE